MIGGLGSGKTYTGADAALQACLENPGADGMIIAPTFPMLWRLAMPAWLAACPKELILRHDKKQRCYLLRGGRTVWYGTAEVPESLEGSNLAWYWGDEARYWRRESHRNMLARLRDKRSRSPQAIYTTTPAMGWLDEEFNRGVAERRGFRISTRENAHNLEAGYIENLERSYSARLCKALIEGDFAVIEGQVYESFDEARHLLDWQFDPRLPTVVAMDFGVRKSSVLFAQETGDFPRMLPDGRTLPPRSIVVFDELQPEQKSTEKTIPMIRDVLSRLGLDRPDRIYCDPAGRGRDIASGMTSVHLLQQAFGRVRYETDPRETWIPTGVAKVDGALAPLVGDPTLYVARRLAANRERSRDNDWGRGIVKSLKGLRYPDVKDGHPVSDHPLKDGYFEHCGDTIRYLVINAQNARRDYRGGTVHALHGGG